VGGFLQLYINIQVRGRQAEAAAAALAGVTTATTTTGCLTGGFRSLELSICFLATKCGLLANHAEVAAEFQKRR